MITTESNSQNIHHKQIPSNPQNENIQPLSGVTNLRKIQTTVLNQMLSHRKGEATCQEKNTKSRLRKSFLYTKPRFSIQEFDKLIIEQRPRQSKSKTKLIAEKLLNDISQRSKKTTNEISIKPIINTNINDNSVIPVSKEQKESNEIIIDNTFDLDKTNVNNSKDNITLNTNTGSKNDKTFLNTKMFSSKNISLSINNADISDIEPSSHTKEHNNTCINIIIPSSRSQNNFTTESININDDTPKTNTFYIQGHINNTVINSSPSKQNNLLSIPQHKYKHKKDSLSSFEETSNDDNTSTKECRKIEINPYRNVNIVKKYFVYQIKKYYLNSITTTTPPHQTSSPHNFVSSLQSASYHEIFTNYSNICSTPGSFYKRYEDKNMQINQYYIYKNNYMIRRRII